MRVECARIRSFAAQELGSPDLAPLLTFFAHGSRILFDGETTAGATLRSAARLPRREEPRYGRREEPRRRRHRRELDQGRAAQGAAQEAAGHRAAGYAAAPAADDHRRPRHERRAPSPRRSRASSTTARSSSRTSPSASTARAVIVRKITVPMMTPAELDEQIHWEAEQHIPFDIKVMSIDYEVLRRRPEAGQMDLLLVAAKKDEINDYASILREAKLRPVVVDINAFTIQNIFEHQYGLPPRTARSRSSTSAPPSRRSTSSPRASAPSPARSPTPATRSPRRSASSCTCSYEQAEAYKCGGGPTQIVPQEVHQIINQACDALAGEIQRSLDFYLATSGEQRDRPHLRLGRQRVPRAARARRSRSARACRCSSSTRWRTSRSTPRSVNEAELRARWRRSSSSRSGSRLRCDKEKRA